MNYYPFHIGDYKSHTEHLEPMEDLAFRRMMDWSYLHEKQLPHNVDEIGRLIRMRSHCDCIEYVLQSFFERTDTGWINNRIDREISKYNDKSEKAKKSAQARWKNKPANNECLDDANALPAESECNANQEPRTKNHNQEPINKEHGFSDWYALYPKKVDKKDCLKIWASKKLYLIADKLIADMKTRAPIIESIAKDKQFIASPARFLRGEKWNDEITTLTSQKKDRNGFTKTNYAEEELASGFGENNI